MNDDEKQRKYTYPDSPSRITFTTGTVIVTRTKEWKEARFTPSEHDFHTIMFILKNTGKF